MMGKGADIDLDFEKRKAAGQFICLSHAHVHTQTHNSLRTVFYSLCCFSAVNTARPSPRCSQKSKDVKQKQNVMNLQN